jgi:hypothetical protein
VDGTQLLGGRLTCPKLRKNLLSVLSHSRGVPGLGILARGKTHWGRILRYSPSRGCVRFLKAPTAFRCGSFNRSSTALRALPECVLATALPATRLSFSPA